MGDQPLEIRGKKVLGMVTVALLEDGTTSLQVPEGTPSPMVQLMLERAAKGLERESLVGLLLHRLGEMTNAPVVDPTKLKQGGGLLFRP